MTEYKMQLEDWLDDLCVRFVINLPKEDLSSVERICFQVEEAQWFYEDFIRPLDPALPSMSLRSFCLRIFQHCPLLSIFSQEHHMQAFEEFLMYKNRIPVRGAIMLNHAMDSAVLVKGWKKGAAWSFPRGKISKDEDDLDCAVREVYEETGFDIRQAGLIPVAEEAKYIDIPMREQHIRLYVFRDVPMDTHFEPRTRKEISKIGWFRLSDLPAFRKKNAQVVDHAEVAKNANKFYMVAPFLVPLKKWVQQQKQVDTRRVVSNGNAQNHYQDDIQAEEEGFKSSIDAVDARHARNLSQRLDTMEGATAALQQLLKIQPPTQGLQDTNASPAPAVLRNTGNDLLALLRGNQPMEKAPSPPNTFHPQRDNGFNSRQPPFMQQQQQQPQPQRFPGPHIVLDQPSQPMPQPARDFRNGQFMMPQPFPQTPQENTFGPQSTPGNLPQQYTGPPPGFQQQYRQPMGPNRDVRSIQMQLPSSLPQTPSEQSFIPMQAPRNPHHHTNNVQPADAHRALLLNAFTTPSASQTRSVATPTPHHGQPSRNPLQQSNVPPLDAHKASLLNAFSTPTPTPTPQQAPASFGTNQMPRNPLEQYRRPDTQAPILQDEFLTPNPPQAQSSAGNGMRNTGQAGRALEDIQMQLKQLELQSARNRAQAAQQSLNSMRTGRDIDTPGFDATLGPSKILGESKTPFPAPADPHKSSLLDMFKSPPTKSATLAQPALSNAAPIEIPRERPSQPIRQPRMPPAPLATAPPTSVSIPVIDPDAPRPRQRRPEGETSMGRRTPRTDRRTHSRPQSMEKPAPFKPTAILSRPQQVLSREVTPQPPSPPVNKVESRPASPKRPDVHEIRRKQTQRQSTPPVTKPFAPMILKRPETKLAEQEAAAAASSAPVQPSAPSPVVVSTPITATVTAAVAERKPSFTETVEQKKELLSMFKGGNAEIAAPEKQKADIRALFKVPEQPKPTAPQQKADLLSMIKAQEKKQTISDQKAELLSLLKSPNTRPTSSHSKSDVPSMSLRADRRPSADGLKADLLAQFKSPERRPSTGSEQKDNLLSMFKAPEMKKSISQSSQQNVLSKFQAQERRPSASADKKMDLLSMFQTQQPKAAVPDQQKADLLSLMRGRDSVPTVEKRGVFDLSRFRSPDARAAAPVPAPEQQKANLLSLLSSGQPRPAPQQQQRSELLSMFNGQQQPQQQSRGTPVDPQKAHLLSLMGGSQPSQASQQNKDVHSMFNNSPATQSPTSGQSTNYNLLSLLKGQDNNRAAEGYNQGLGQRLPGFSGENQGGSGPLPQFSMRRQSQEGSAMGQPQMQRQPMPHRGQDKGYLLNYLNGLGKGSGI